MTLIVGSEIKIKPAMVKTLQDIFGIVFVRPTGKIIRIMEVGVRKDLRYRVSMNTKTQFEYTMIANEVEPLIKNEPEMYDV